MDKDDVARLEAHLVYLRESMERLEEGLRPEPTCLSYPDAARKLGVGVTKLRQMVERGEIRPSLVGKTRMISMAELERVSAPVALPATRRGQPKSRKPKARGTQDSAALRAALKT